MFDDTATPKLPRGVKLQFDSARDHWVLLGPERILKPDVVAVEILKRIDGQTSIDAIVDDLATTFKADRAQILKDVRSFLENLSDKRMIDVK